MPSITLNYSDATAAHYVAANNHRNAREQKSLTPKQRLRELAIGFIIGELIVEEWGVDAADLDTKKSQWESEVDFT